MYVPVVTRFRTYAVHVDSMCHNYMEAILDDPDFLAWEAQAELDPAPGAAALALRPSGHFS